MDAISKNRNKVSHYFLLVLFSVLLFYPGLNKIPAIDRDEAHFAQASRQMIQTGNYFQVRFQDKTRFQKPPGINWLQAAVVNLLSNADATKIGPYRVPSLLAAFFSVLLTYYFSSRFLKQRTALLGSAFLAASLLLLIEAHMAVIDASLLFSVLVMQGALWIIYQAAMQNKRAAWGWAFCFWLALALGFVLKGVTPLIAVLTIVSLILIERRMDCLRGLRPFSGLILFLLLSLSWLILLNDAEQSNYLMQMIHRDLLPKLQGGHESHGKPPLFHLLILPMTFWPGSLFLWQSGRYALQHKNDPRVKFLLAWLIPTWVFFELMPTKLPQYVLPLFPALALLTAMALERANRLDKPGKFLHALQLLWGFMSFVFALFLLLLPYLLMKELPWVSWILLGLISFGSATAVYLAWYANYHRAAYILLAMTLVTSPLIFENLLPQLKPLWLTSRVVELIDKNKLSNEKPLLVVGFDEPSLVFNLNTGWVQFTDSQYAKNNLQLDSSRLALIESTALTEWKKEPNSFTILGQAEGYDYSKGHWLRLFIVAGEQSGNN